MEVSSLKSKLGIIGGMPRAGTTYLYYTLSKHPEAFITGRKEIDFFTSINFDRGAQWYASLFDEVSSEKVAFDVTPHYFMDPEAPARLVEFDPSIPVWIMLRNPISWLISYYRHLNKINFEGLTMEALLSDGFTFEKEGGTLHLDFSPGSVIKRVGIWQNAGLKNLAWGNFEAFDRDPLGTVKAVEEFFGLSDYFTADNLDASKINAADKKPIKFINVLKRNKMVMDLAERLLPRKLIFKANEKIAQRQMANSSGPERDFESEFGPMLKEHFKEDIQFLEDMFQGKVFV